MIIWLLTLTLVGKTDQKHFIVAEKVWVKLRGHQWWPGQIVEYEKVKSGYNYTVIFYLDNTFSYVTDYQPSLMVIQAFEGNQGIPTPAPFYICSFFLFFILLNF